MEAEFRNGVLTVTLPKREETKPRTISIKEQAADPGAADSVRRGPRRLECAPSGRG